MTELAVRALGQLGAQLRAAGLTPRGLAAWAGTARVAALPRALEAVAEPATPAGALLALLASGREVAVAQLDAPVTRPLIEPLIAHGLVERSGDRLRAPLAVIPLGPSLLVCDRLDAPAEAELVCWPDDSSHHLAAAIPPGRRDHWLDLGCGSAFAPLARPELASRITGIDLNQRAVRYAQLGAALSALPQLTISLGDAGAAHEPADLVSCNAPIPDAANEALAPLANAVPEIWRRTDASFFTRLWPALQRAMRPGGMIVVHAAADALAPLADAPGERVIVSYTPPGVRGFAVAWWRPDAPARHVVTQRLLTADRPHIDARDRDDALG